MLFPFYVQFAMHPVFASMALLTEVTAAAVVILATLDSPATRTLTSVRMIHAKTVPLALTKSTPSRANVWLDSLTNAVP